jgi:hypothetical protein
MDAAANNATSDPLTGLFQRQVFVWGVFKVISQSKWPNVFIAPSTLTYRNYQYILAHIKVGFEPHERCMLYSFICSGLGMHVQLKQ